MELKRVNIYIEPDKWERFKKIAKHRHSDASKEIRKIVDEYLAKYNQLFLEIEGKKATIDKGSQ